MAIEKPMVPADLEIESNPSEEELTVEIVNPDSVSMETEDGGVVLDFTGELTEDLIGTDHDGNLASFLPTGKRSTDSHCLLPRRDRLRRYALCISATKSSR